MRRLWLNFALTATTLLVLVPALLGRSCARPSAQARTVPLDIPVMVYFPDSQLVAAVPLEEYVKGVVAAEMPPDFEPEALKAQAVLARTYAVAYMRRFGGRGCDLDPRADVCATPAAGQAYLDRTQLGARLGTLAAQRFWGRIEEAQAATRGLILTYQGAAIEALYHSTSGQTTEDAGAVWGRSLPYLVPVPDPLGAAAPRYTETVAFTPGALVQALGLRNAAIPVAAGASPLAIVERTPGGRVARVNVAGAVLSGVEVRRRLGLRSANFTSEYRDGQVRITTYGYGHGVGMSQWGANGMAQEGKPYQEILAHYYRGTRLEPLFGG